MRRLALACTLLLALLAAPFAAAQEAPGALVGPLQDVLQANAADVERASRRTVGPVLDAILATGHPEARALLRRWQDKGLYLAEDGRFVYAEREGEGYAITDIETGEALGAVGRREVKQLKPNSGVRGQIASALVRFQLVDPDPVRRARALTSIERRPDEAHLKAVRAALDDPDPRLAARKARLERLLTVRFGEGEARLAAIRSLDGDLGVEARAALNPLLSTRSMAGEAPPEEGVAGTLTPGTDALPDAQAYDLLVEADLAPPRIGDDARDAALVAHIEDGAVAGVPVASLDTEAARWAAHAALAERGLTEPAPTPAERSAAVEAHAFWEAYALSDSEVTEAAAETLASIERRVALWGLVDRALDAVSLGSIYFLAAIGLAITFGVMRVINMAHGEFIMMGAYTGYVVQTVIPDHTLSIAAALPLAFAVTFAAGVALERLVIRWLYDRPLETLLATFGVSIALQQLAKTIFGTQARPLTSPDWLSGAWAVNEVTSIATIRLAIFALALIFLVLLLVVLRRTRLGLEVRAVTQNPRMAASMGIDPGRVNMLTFGLGSGIAGIAGVAIGLFAQVTSELGQQYIVQSFMTVVVGGVGNVWGTLAGAALIGGLQKGIEGFNPSNTLAAQTFMILFVILFIQVRPRGLIPQRGRAAEA